MLRVLQRTVLPVIWLSGGYAIVHGVLLAILGSYLSNEFSGRRDWHDGVVLTREGEPLIERRVFATDTRSYRKPNGEPVKIPKEQQKLFLPVCSGGDIRDTPAISSANWQARIEARYYWHEDPSDRIIWFAIIDNLTTHRVYWVGYASVGNRLVGYISRRGFVAEHPQPEEMFELSPHAGNYFYRALSPRYFDYGGNTVLSSVAHSGADEVVSIFPQTKVIPTWVTYLADAQGVYEINFREQTQRLLMPGVQAYSLGIYSRPLPGKMDTSTGFRHHIRVRLADEILLCDPATGMIDRLTIPTQLRSGSSLFAERSQAGPIWLGSWQPSSDSTSVQLIQWQTAEGGEERPPLEFSLKYSSDTPLLDNLLLVAASPFPVGVLTIGTITALDPIPGLRPGPGFASRLMSRLNALQLPLLLTTLIGLLLAAWCWRRQQLYRAGGTALWLPFVFLFGWPAMVGYLCHRAWPVLKISPWITGQPIVPPALKGTEIFG